MAPCQGQEGLDFSIYTDMLKEEGTPEVRDESRNTEYKSLNLAGHQAPHPPPIHSSSLHFLMPIVFKLLNSEKTGGKKINKVYLGSLRLPIDVIDVHI